MNIAFIKLTKKKFFSLFRSIKLISIINDKSKRQLISFCLFPEDDKCCCRKLKINLRDFHRKLKDALWRSMTNDASISRLIFTAAPQTLLVPSMFRFLPKFLIFP